MKSGVYYLYEYKNNQKSRNVGFLKLSQNSESCHLQLCARGISVFHGDSASLSILCSAGQDLLITPGQSISCENHAITCKVNLPLQNSAVLASPDDICGFLLELPNKIYIAATENGLDFSLQKCRPADVMPTEAKSTVTTSYDIMPEPTVTVNPDPITEPTVTSASDSALESAIEHSTAAIPFSTEKPKNSVRKIQRADLSILPRKYWNLANNRFLMHGYYNYNHLLLVEENGHFLIGVPGIYDKREARAADLFGFPTFSESYTKSLNLSSEETTNQGCFGYWCRKIPADTE